MNQQYGTTSKTAAPYVSVIVPAYNIAGYLERALDSALAQTMPDLEVIVVDDASGDATYEVARSAAARDNRVRVLRNERNRGLAASRNRAMDAARGEWVALLDGDDAWLPKRLEHMMTYAPSADVISDDLYVVAKSHIKPGEHVFWSLLRERGLNITKPHRLTLQEFTRYNIGLIHPIFRRSFLKQNKLAYDASMHIAEDFHFYFEILWKGARWLQLPYAYYLYTLGRASSLSSDEHALWQSTIERTQSLLDHPAAAEDAELAAALERRMREGQDILVYDTIRSMVWHHRFADFAIFLLEQPSSLSLIIKRIKRSFYIRLVLSRRLAEMEGLQAPDLSAHALSDA
jgi:glycosyltransferase involved in cell wall biosynthesis